MTARRRPRPARCAAHDRVVYRSQDQAIGAAIALFELVPMGNLAVYRCDETGAWHVTTSSYRAALRVVS